MNKEEIKAIWEKHELSCRNSYAASFIKRICCDFGVEFSDDWIYTEPKRRELPYVSKDTPKIDAQSFLLFVCKKHNILPEPSLLACASRMHGEGSRRQLVEEAFLGRV